MTNRIRKCTFLDDDDVAYVGRRAGELRMSFAGFLRHLVVLDRQAQERPPRDPTIDKPPIQHMKSKAA